MAELEFLPPADEQSPDETAEPHRPRWRSFVQPGLLVALVGGAAALVVLGSGSHRPAPTQHTPQPLPTITPVHIHRYVPMHERLIQGGGGAYIF